MKPEEYTLQDVRVLIRTCDLMETAQDRLRQKLLSWARQDAARSQTRLESLQMSGMTEEVPEVPQRHRTLECPCGATYEISVMCSLRVEEGGKGDS